ncbi:hypothetical protein [Micromonospora sp. KC213]|uniref:hypothetical protein n=1 Tax=Micromonospora sp. KC213 TaxID=2530378 RepID=UPI00104D8D1F|nr:hypothetical protein [Micromonospora sp. KC213]TDC28696.1 hypothetical protein E1166_30425 [Micromonospora sp. KC213]
MTAIFTPAPFTPGDRITWAQISADGTEVARTGVVWSLAPTCHASPSVWVTPDNGGAPVVVVKARKRSRIHAGRVWGGEWSPSGGRLIAEGEAFSESHPLTQTGALTEAAVRHTAQIRAA